MKMQHARVLDQDQFSDSTKATSLAGFAILRRVLNVVKP